MGSIYRVNKQRFKLILLMTVSVLLLQYLYEGDSKPRVGSHKDAPIHSSMLKRHSQYGQDIYIQKTYFPNERTGIFLESGAFDGIMYSNTLMFEELGWTGVLVEPLPSRFEQLKVNRPNTVNINKAFAPTRGIVQFSDVANGMLSGIDKFIPDAHRKRQERESGDKIKKIDVATIPVHELLNELDIYHVDLFSLDTEGSEIDILESIDWDLVDISILVIETNFAEDRRKLRNAMEMTDLYVKDEKYEHNLDDIWIQKKWLAANPDVQERIGIHI